MLRSTLTAGLMTADANIAGKTEPSLMNLLEFDCVTDGVRVGDLLRERLELAEAAVDRQAADGDDAALAGEAAEHAHTEEAARLQREVRRVRLAIERSDARMAEVAAQERRAAAEAASRRACELAARMEAKVRDYVASAETIRDLLQELDQLGTELVRERKVAFGAGIECDAQLPHEVRFRPERTVEQIVVVAGQRIGVFDLHGDPVGPGGSRHFGSTSEVTDDSPITRRERVVVQERHAPQSILHARALLPHPDGGAILDRQ